MEEKIEQVLRLLAMDIREYMSQEKWVTDAKRALYPIIFSNQVEPPVKPACESCKHFRQYDEGIGRCYLISKKAKGDILFMKDFFCKWFVSKSV